MSLKGISVYNITRWLEKPLENPVAGTPKTCLFNYFLELNRNQKRPLSIFSVFKTFNFKKFRPDTIAGGEYWSIVTSVL